MGLFKRKNDPIAERTQILNAQIAELEARIKTLGEQNSKPPVPAGLGPGDLAASPTPALSARPAEPIFLNASRKQTTAAPEDRAAPELYNDFGVRKYDLAGAINWLVGKARGPGPSNPRLIKYLASGGLQGLRPLRYEKRVARNRFIVLVIGFTLLLWAILAAFLHNR